MAWTEESIVAEFRQHVDYWQTKLRMRDLQVRVEVANSDGQSYWCRIEPDNGGDNDGRACIWIVRGRFEQVTRFEVWGTVAHELVHAMNWRMSQAFEPLVDYFAVAQLNLAKALMKRGNESIAYKWEALLGEWFAADAPPKEIPE